MLNNYADFLNEKLSGFRHPEIDSAKTLVTTNEYDDYSVLEVRIFDNDGSYVGKDVIHPPFVSVPGLLFRVNNDGTEGSVDMLYINPEYSSQRIGTELFLHFEPSAREAGIPVLSLIADDETGAQQYWIEKHGFESAGEDDHRLLVKKIN
ncbi:GNAT family N-acetyltransferase [Candidatus Woesearchaeota archaeon]|nr:GNAT family N-acetyltransferase [Candidatus Woesearchaeota archaeon]